MFSGLAAQVAISLAIPSDGNSDDQSIYSDDSTTSELCCNSSGRHVVSLSEPGWPKASCLFLDKHALATG